MKHQLAIVIPAFKIDFFEATLASIAAQEDKRFVVYIGDDASPDDLQDVVIHYQSEITIVYQRFEKNLGRENLVAHWERCIAMTKDEEWIWLFSDDDIMGAGCITTFYDFLGDKGILGVDLLHFDMKVIDENSQQIWPHKGFPAYLSCADFFVQRIRGELYSTVVEYVFRRSKWMQVGQFERFDLAWFSDDATWIKLSREGGIHSIVGPVVYWRYGGRNISSQHTSSDLVVRKVQSGLNFFKWVDSYFGQYRVMDRSSLWEKIRFLLSVPLNSTVLSWKEKQNYADYISRQMEAPWPERMRARAYVCFFGFRHLVRIFLRKMQVGLSKEIRL